MSHACHRFGSQTVHETVLRDLQVKVQVCVTFLGGKAQKSMVTTGPFFFI